MSTRALQIECLLDPVIDPNSGAIASGYTVYFYEAGTATPKNVWTEKEKTNPFTSKTLGSDGTVQLYGQGIYKVVIKDLDGDTIHEWDDIKIEAYNHSIVTKTVNYTADSDDDIILVDTSSGNKTLSLDPVANFTHPITIKNTGSNTVTVDPDGAETIDGAATVTLSTENKTLTLYPDQDAGEWKKAERDESYITDDDGDTKVMVEEAADEDKVRMDIAGTGRFVLDSTRLDLTNGTQLRVGGVFESTGRITASDGFSDGTNDIDFPTNQMSNCILMTGESSTVLWMYLNTAPPGWKVVSGVTDVGLAISGGSGAYNVNGGNVAGETWANLKAHTHSTPDHTHPSHNHQWHHTEAASDGSYSSGGSESSFTQAELKAPSEIHIPMVEGNSSTTYAAGADLYTTKTSTPSGGSGTSGAQSTADVRPTAAVGKLFQLDQA